MTPIPSPSQKAANALRRAERALRNWQDDPDSPRSDVDKMLAIIMDLRSWVQGHVISDIERPHNLHPPARMERANPDKVPPPSDPTYTIREGTPPDYPQSPGSIDQDDNDSHHRSRDGS